MTNELDLDGIKTLHGRAVTGVQDWMTLPILELVEVVPELISEVERLRAKIESVRKALDTEHFLHVGEYEDYYVIEVDDVLEALEGKEK